MFGRLGTVLEMIKVQHSLFALPWAFVAAFYAAGGLPAWSTMGWILLAMVAARSSAMAFNRAVDAKIDAENPRTALRAIPAGRLTRGFTLAFAVVMAGLLVFAAWRLNDLCLKLSPIALAVTLGYSFTKRFTALCHWVLGLSLAAAPIGAWLAVAPDRATAPLPYLLGAAVCFWIAGADILYACEDFEFDRRKRLHSVPAKVGIRAALWISVANHVLAVAALAAAGLDVSAFNSSLFSEGVSLAIFVGVPLLQEQPDGSFAIAPSELT
ncbi:MAG TPA: UbiA-like polyprenyltransferase, partial [Planctomycetota bacterium]|nr:UbiA-like polyprenyltransferase [Planctomycetota bacterium]